MAWFRRRGDRDSAASASAEAEAPDGPHIEAPNEAERDWIGDQLDQLTDAGVDIEDAAQLGAYYDSLLTAWESVPEHERPDPNPMINVVGIGLGEHLILGTGLMWAVATDDAGTEIAIHGQPGNVLIYPTNAVAKRWVAGERGFLPDFAAWTSAQVAEIRAAN